MKAKGSSEIGRVLRKCAQFFDDVSEEDIQRFLNGELKLELVGHEPRRGRAEQEGEAGPSDLQQLAERLQATESREAAAKILRDDRRVSAKSDLAKLARHLHVHVDKHDKRETIEEKIVEAVIGVRLRSQAIHGLSLKGTSTSKAEGNPGSGEDGSTRDPA